MLGRKPAKGHEKQLQLTAFFTPRAAGKRKFSSGIGDASSSERPRKKGRVKENVLLPLSPASSPRRGTNHAVSRNKDHQPREEDEYATPVQTKRHDDAQKAGSSRTSSVDNLRLPLSPRSARRGNFSSAVVASDKRRLPAAALPTPPPTHQYLPKRTLPPFVLDDSDDVPESTPTPMPNKAHIPTPRTPPRTSKGKQRARSDSPIDLCSPDITSPLTSLPPSPEPTTVQRVATVLESPGDEIVPSSQTQVLEWNPFLEEPAQAKPGEFVFKQPALPASRARLSTLGHGSPSRLTTSFSSPSRRIKVPPPLKTRGLTTSPVRSPSTSSRGSSQIVPTSQTEEEELIIGGTSLSPMRRRREQMQNFTFQFNWDDRHARNRSGGSDEIVPTSQSDERELVIPSPRMGAPDLPKPEHNNPPLRFGDVFTPVSTAGPHTPPKPRPSASPCLKFVASPKAHKVTFADVDLSEPPRTPERHPPRAAAYASASSNGEDVQSSQTVPEWASTPPRPYYQPRRGPAARPKPSQSRNRTPEAHIESSVTEPESSQWRDPSQLPSLSQQRRDLGLPPLERAPAPEDESQTQPESSQWLVPSQLPSRSQQRRDLGLPPLKPAPEDESQTQPESSQWRDPSQLPSRSQQRRMKGLPIPDDDGSQTQPESSQSRVPSQMPSRSQQRRMKGLPIPEEDRVPEDSSQTEPESSQWRVPSQLPSHSQQCRMKGLPDPRPVETRVPEPLRTAKQRRRPAWGLPDDEIVPSQELGSLPYADEESQYHFDFDLEPQPQPQPQSQDGHDAARPPSFDGDDVEEETVTLRVSKRKCGYLIRWIREEAEGDPSKVSGSPPTIPGDYEASINGSQVELEGMSRSLEEFLTRED